MVTLCVDCICDRVEGEYSRRRPQSPASQYGVQPERPLSSALLRDTESSRLKGEHRFSGKTSVNTVVHTVVCMLAGFFSFLVPRAAV